MPIVPSSKLRAALLAGVAAFAALGPAGTASAEGNRPCGKVTTARGTFQVTTFGAGGPSCATARRVVRATYGKPLRRSYRGYRCSRGTGDIVWSCSASGARNITVLKPGADPTR